MAHLHWTCIRSQEPDELSELGSRIRYGELPARRGCQSRATCLAAADPDNRRTAPPRNRRAASPEPLASRACSPVSSATGPLPQQHRPAHHVARMSIVIQTSSFSSRRNLVSGVETRRRMFPPRDSRAGTPSKDSRPRACRVMHQQAATSASARVATPQPDSRSRRAIFGSAARLPCVRPGR
jgi:hypothetical protein